MKKWLVRTFYGVLIFALSLGFVVPLSAETASADSVDKAAIDASGELQYLVTIDQPSQPVSVADILEAASSIEGTVNAVRFEGEQGVGELFVASDDTAEVIEAAAIDLFASVNSDVPPIAGGIVSTATPMTDDEAAVFGAIATVTRIEDSEPLQSSPKSSKSGSSSSQNRSNAQASTIPNDWSPWFPSDWRAEARTVNRCTNYSSAQGRCLSTIQLASLNQTITWSGSNSPAAWPNSSWGFEFGVDLKNYTLCNSSPSSTPGWWLNPSYYEWATNVPAAAKPYLDKNRLFDPCESMSHELGIRYPGLLTSGASYIFNASTQRNVYRSSSTYSAQFQAVHDDCLAGQNLTDCMGLNQNVAFPYAGDQSETVVNINRYLSFPNCVRMHDSWSAPISWGNGSSRLMPAPLNYYDSCLSNDW